MRSLPLPQVLRNDVLSHHSTVETVNGAAGELLESTPADEVSHLRDRLDTLNHSWEGLLLKTQERQKLLEAALHQVSVATRRARTARLGTLVVKVLLSTSISFFAY